MARNIKDEPREWGGGHKYTQYDMDELEIRKVRALERIADALDGHSTSKWSGNVSDDVVKPRQSDNPKSTGFTTNLFDCFKL